VSQWTSPGRIVTGIVSAAALVVALASMSGTQRAQSLGLTQHGTLITAQDAGAADAVAAVAVTPGTVGQVLTVSDAGLPHWAAAPSGGGGGGATVTTLYAADGTPVNGGGAASVSGTGSTSTFTLTGAGTSTYGSPGVTSPSLSFTIPAGASVIEVETQITALNNVATAGYRFLGMVLRNSGTSTPTAAWGVSHNDNGVVYGGGLLNGLNGAPHTSSSAWPFNNLDRWQRATLLPRVPQISVHVATASAGVRPTTWTSLATPIPLLTSSSGAVPDTGVATALAIVLQSFSAGASTVTGRVTVRVTL
jgi:hypothetical protein